LGTLATSVTGTKSRFTSKGWFGKMIGFTAITPT
jgi:hypothetical protein